ncbi:Rho termination factor N-terminal domain-containing protein [Pantanalinema sp. GBBB05]|uniref:Rho termination factor N-terminal domain-containing protein n=1 Tax=Pantanalinema sp. GBBB05 TaxID=2604139 RepID=UPI001DBEC58A|nr:hypothetical protein [Pantanalinema sp. GBBB05]
MTTVSQLRQQAKARKIKGYSRMNKAQLMSALGVSEDAKIQEAGKSKRTAKAEPTKTARAIATAITRKHGGNPAEVEAQLKKSIQSAVDKKRRQLKKEGREVTQKDLRAAAIAGVKATVQRSAKSKPKDEPKKPPAKSEPKKERKPKPKDEPKVEPVQPKEEPRSQPSKEVKTRSAELGQVKADLEKEFGKEFVAKAEKNFQKIVDESDVFVRVPDSAIDKIIGAGRFKSSFEAGRKGKDYNKRRGQTEDAMFGYGADTDPTKRPIYGYLGEKEFDGSSWSQTGPGQYGNVVVRLKSDVKTRASVTDNDTWNASLPSSATSVSAASLAGGRTAHMNVVKVSISKDDPMTRDEAEKGLQAAADAKGVSDFLSKKMSPYIETHIHGGLGTSDIGEVIFTNGSKPSKKMQNWAKKNGVTITIK